MFRKAAPRRGYVLLMTLMLIPIAGVMLASIERLTFSRALDASRAERQLQQRWLVVSAQSTLLNQAATVMDQEQERNREPTAAKADWFMIGERRLELVFTDEQAKPNLNALWGQYSPEKCQDVVKNLLENSAGAAPIVFQPTPREMQALYSEGNFATFDQVFPHVGPQVLIGTPTLFDGPASAITLWGSGRLNFHRASPAALKEVCDPALGLNDLQKLLNLRKSQPGLSLIKLVTLLGASKEKRAFLMGALADRSEAFGLWIKLQEGDQTQYHFGVIQGGVINVDSW